MSQSADSIREEAAIWLTRLREGGEPVRAQFEAWRAQSPAHAAAFSEIESIFEVFKVPTQQLAVRDATRAAERSGRRWLMAASIVACAVLLTWQRHALVDLRSDAVTAAGKTTTLALPDGSTVALNTRTSLRARHAEGERGVHLNRGEAYFEVAKDPAHPFVVEAGDARIQVLGTRFNVRMNDGGVVVTVDEGRVSLSSTDKSAILGQGDQGSLDATNLRVLSNVDRTVSSAWRDGKVVFYETPLAEVVAELNRYRDVPILVVGQGVRERRISGMFKLLDTDNAVTNIEQTFQVRSLRLPVGLTILY